jgi:hypothetical protein
MGAGSKKADSILLLFKILQGVCSQEFALLSIFLVWKGFRMNPR